MANYRCLSPPNSEFEPRRCLLFVMASSSYYMQEPPVTHGYSTLFGHGLETGDWYEDRLPLFEDISYLSQVSDPCSPYQEYAFHDSISSPYENDQLPYNSWRNWDGEYESCFAFSDYLDDNYFSYESSIGHGNGLQKTENWFGIEQYIDNFVSHYDNAGSVLSYDDCLQSGYESCFGCLREDDDSCYYTSQKPSNACSYSMDEIGFCEGIFGYWPCLSQKHPIAYSE
ncbi:conserved hypothetical protein [Ricinus communis]|uniref:Uncharacterized protein n=1 Tax=Ricinus communis TaxID=3988 RepID=B9SGV0_RICCO|nr:conserved hypothetical protein [Ricinus communis]